MTRNLIRCVIFSLLLSGCMTTQNERCENKNLIPINQSCYLQTSCLNQKGMYLQKVRVNFNDQMHVFSVHVSIDSEILEARAFNDLCSSLYYLRWTPEKTTWESSDYIPDVLHPNYIIADFMLTHLTLHQLQLALKGAQVKELGNERIIECNGKIIRRITRSNPLGHLWQKVIIQNTELGYKLTIETIPL